MFQHGHFIKYFISVIIDNNHSYIFSKDYIHLVFVYNFKRYMSVILPINFLNGQLFFGPLLFEDFFRCFNTKNFLRTICIGYVEIRCHICMTIMRMFNTKVITDFKRCFQVQWILFTNVFNGIVPSKDVPPVGFSL